MRFSGTAGALVGLIFSGMIAYAAPSDARILAPCRYEDGSGQRAACVWDGRHMGNGNGRSYIVRKSGDVTYVTHKRAHRLLGGTR